MQSEYSLYNTYLLNLIANIIIQFRSLILKQNKTKFLKKFNISTVFFNYHEKN